MIAFDSNMVIEPPLIAGTSPSGLSFLYSGVSSPPNDPPTVTRSNSTPASPSAHSAFWTLLELRLPQIVIIGPSLIRLPADCGRPDAGWQVDAYRSIRRALRC